MTDQPLDGSALDAALSPTPSVGRSTLAYGVGRVADNERALLCVFRAIPTDDDIRKLHDALASSSASPKGGEDRELRSLAQIRLWFFRDISEDVRRKLYRLCGHTAIDDMPLNHGVEVMMFKDIFSALSEASERERSSNPSKCEREAEKEGDDRADALERILARAKLPAPESQTLYDMRARIFDIQEIALSALSKREARPTIIKSQHGKISYDTAPKQGDARNAVIEECAQHLRTVADASETPSITRFFTAAAQELDALKSSADRGGQL